MWTKELITDGEIDALQKAAFAACNDDTRYPLWRGSHNLGNGECYNLSRWLVERLGGYVGTASGHYVWLAPDDSMAIDLTGGHAGPWTYEANDGRYQRIATVDNARSQRFINRANRIFDSLDTLLRLSVDLGGDAFPAEEPQAADDSERFNVSGPDVGSYWHDEPTSPPTPEGVYQFIYANGQLDISPNHTHDELSSHAEINPAQYNGPFAAGHVAVTQGQATWEVQSNVNLHALLRIFKDATKDYGWRWGGLTDAEGQPITEDFAPKKAVRILHFALVADHLLLGRSSSADLVTRSDNPTGRILTGTLTLQGAKVRVHPVYLDALPHLFEWANDNELRLYGGNDNVIKTIPDLELHNVGDDTTDPYQNAADPVEPSPKDERLPSGLYRCPACEELFPNWHEYQKHRREQESWGDTDRERDYGFPEPDPGQFGDGAHFTEQRQEPGITTGSVLPARSWKEAARVDGFTSTPDSLYYVSYRQGSPVGYAAVSPEGDVYEVHSAVGPEIIQSLWSKLYSHFGSLQSTEPQPGWVQARDRLWRWSKDQAPADLLDSPMPFIYDVDKDKIYAGQPGSRTSDIPGRFTPGGIVEGMYEPGGKVVIRTMTSVPYTVRHMIELWYYTNPQLEVKSVHLKDDAGKDTRLASVGSQISLLAAMDPAIHLASWALQNVGGEVYVVGGAVRDVLMGNEPNDFDLMVTGITGFQVESALRQLPGSVAHEGRDFKVFHYRHKGNVVHVALPRKERSTGPGHEDFDVESDPSMKPEDDFYRRDFTVNAMGVNLRNAQLLDPFGGAADIASGTLRTLSASSFSDDPLRVVRGLVAVSRHGLDPDETTRVQMRENAHCLSNLAAERIRDELDKLMESGNPAKGIRLAHDTGVLQYMLPEVEAAFGYNQNNPHHELELGEHLVNVLGRICTRTEDPDLRLAALLHDIGKPASAWTDPETGKNHYYAHHVRDEEGKRTGEVLGANHEEMGAKLTHQLLTNLRYPNARIERITALVANHMYAGFTTPTGARRFLAKVGSHADDLFLLRWADSGGKNHHPDPSKADDPAWNPERNRRLVDHVRASGDAFTVKDLAIDGRDLIKDGMEPGPQMGQILSSLTEQVIEDPTLNDRDTLLRLANEHS